MPNETADHCRVVLVRTGCWSTTKYELDDIMKYAYMVTDFLNRDPRVQIHGWVGLIDLEGITTAHVQQMTPQFVKNAVKCWQVIHNKHMPSLTRWTRRNNYPLNLCFKETYPARIKGIHFINYPKIFDVALSVIKMFLKDKTKDRVSVQNRPWICRRLHSKYSTARVPR